MPRRRDLQLSRERVVEVALDLFRSEGLAALSTRRVAAALGASPMSLYVHVGNKEGLLDAVVEAWMTGIKIDLDSEGAWTDQALQWVHALRDQLRAQPDVMPLLRTRRWAVVRCTEPLVRTLLAAGFEQDEAVRATRILTWSTMGFLMIEAGVETLPAGNGPIAELARSLDQLRTLEDDRPPPATRPEGVGREDIDALFAIQSRLLIDGLARERSSHAN